MVAIALIAGTLVNAQLKVLNSGKRIDVGKVKMGMYYVAHLSYTVQDSDSIYTIMYRNAKYQHIDSYETTSFTSNNGEVEQLYNLIKSVFSLEDIKGYSASVDLNGDYIKIVGTKNLGVKSVVLMTSSGYTNGITENQVDKLFGK